eukprot:1144803-Pelagomonas_calceolata.AAC.6
MRPRKRGKSTSTLCLPVKAGLMAAQLCALRKQRRLLGQRGWAPSKWQSFQKQKQAAGGGRMRNKRCMKEWKPELVA